MAVVPFPKNKIKGKIKGSMQIHAALARSRANDNKIPEIERRGTSVPVTKKSERPKDHFDHWAKSIKNDHGNSISTTSAYEHYINHVNIHHPDHTPLSLPKFINRMNDKGYNRQHLAGRQRFVGISLPKIQESKQELRNMLKEKHSALVSTILEASKKVTLKNEMAKWQNSGYGNPEHTDNHVTMTKKKGQQTHVVRIHHDGKFVTKNETAVFSKSNKMSAERKRDEAEAAQTVAKYKTKH